MTDSLSHDLDQEIILLNAELIKARALLEKNVFFPGGKDLVRKLISYYESKLDRLLAMRLISEKQL
jgi:hypothetical protein